MQSVIDELYDGEIRPCEFLMAQNPEYWKKVRAISAEKQYISGLLGDEDKLRFEQLDNMQMLLGEYCERAYFAYGLKLGVRLMVEALGEEVPVRAE